ncbi:MAG: alcohol dehydrogenase catalytic domain-containing protein [Chloroflexi bacterium]|nr:alcohol dehydrogenase catalytic domain-containing protein [Chloroflexota bacterium]
MRALFLQHGQLFLRTDYPQPQPQGDEALLRVRMAGVCGTDLALLKGYKGGVSLVLGHEYVAEVIAAPGHEEWVGRRVVGEINTACGQCEHCKRGLITHCLRRRVLGIMNWDGAFAEYMVSPIANLHPVPANISDEQAVFTEPLAAAYAALRDMPSDAGERIVIFGDGKLGQLIARVFHVEGYDPLLVGRHEAKLALAAAVNIRTLKVQSVREVTQLPEFDVAVDATGNPQAISDILACLRPRGTLILKTTTEQPSDLDLAEVVVNELRIIGSRCGPFPPALAALETGRIDPRPLISARYPLTQGVQALQRASQRDSLKVLVIP